MSDIKDAQDRAIKASLREDRARDAARALLEIDTKKKADLAKTSRLRALRLAQESGGTPTSRRRQRSQREE
jgi:hypothetical protein